MPSDALPMATLAGLAAKHNLMAPHQIFALCLDRYKSNLSTWTVDSIMTFGAYLALRPPKLRRERKPCASWREVRVGSSHG
jgi:hypothetical protein